MATTLFEGGDPGVLFVGMSFDMVEYFSPTFVVSFAVPPLCFTTTDLQEIGRGSFGAVYKV